MNNDEYIEFKNLSESEQKKAAEKMTREELRDLGQLAVPDLKKLLEAKPKDIYVFGEETIEYEYFGNVNPFKRVKVQDDE